MSSHSKRSTSSSSSDTSAILGHPRAPSSSSAAAVTAHAHQFDLPRPPGPSRHSQSTVPINCGGLSDTDSSDDSTYSSQYQSDANSTPTTRQSNTLPRPLTGGGQGYGTRARHGAVRRAVPAEEGSPGKSLTDYEREISELRTAMETLKVKLTEAESRLVQESASGAPARAEGEVRVIVNRLAEDEDQLRRTENYANGGQG